MHDAGQVTLLRHLHDRLDAAVAAAYGWPTEMSDADILARLVALNAERVREEAAGKIRWLRPEYQSPRAGIPAATGQGQASMHLPAPTEAVWPRERPAQYLLLRNIVAGLPTPATPAEILRQLPAPPRGTRVAEMLGTLAALGQVRTTPDGRYAA